MPAGHIAGSLRLSPSALSFHFYRLRDAGLVTVRREGRSMIYTAQFDTMNTLLGYRLKIAAKAVRRSAGPMVGQNVTAIHGAQERESVMKLYMFEHCSLCFRVRMIAALKRLAFAGGCSLSTTIPTPWSGSSANASFPFW